MPKNRLVKYDGSVFGRIIPALQKAFPRELGGFLLSDHWRDGDGETFYVSDFLLCRPGTDSTWFLYPEDLAAAVKKAARQGLVVTGIFHSHPWEELPPYAMTNQSHVDADLQESLALPLSLIVGICPEFWISSTWRLGYAAPYPEEVDGLDVHEWAATHRLRSTRRHFYLVK